MSNITNYTRPRYIESDDSEVVVVGALKTPTLLLDGDSETTTGELSWSINDSKAEIFEIYASYNSGDYYLYNSIQYPQSTYQLSNNLEPGTYKFKIRSKAIIDNYTYYSSFSNETFSFTVYKLSKPELIAISGTSKYYWTKINNASTYRFVETKYPNLTTSQLYSSDEIPTYSNPILIKKTEVGVYVYTVTAYSDNEFLYHTSETSNIEKYNVYRLETPSITSFSVDDEIATWDSITNASGYNIYLNNSLIYENYPSTNFDYTSYRTSSIYSYSTYIKAIKDTNGENYPNPYYMDSNSSNEISWGVIPDPIIELNTTKGEDNIVLIKNFEELFNAEYFEIYNDNTLYMTIPASNDKFKLESTVSKVFNVYLKAVSSQDNITDSGNSNTISYSVINLKTPEIVLISALDNTITIRWDRIFNADYYDIYVGQTKYTTTNLTINLQLPIGYNNVYMIAKSYYYKYLDSLPSNIISKYINSNSRYSAEINGTLYELNLPLTFTHTLDDSMDTGLINLVPNDINEPFEAFTEVKISVSDYNEDTGFHFADGFPKYMIISQDDVEEIQIGNNSKYAHHINLIERTKLLENILMPDFSITQPIEYTIKINTNKTKRLPEYDNKANIFTRSTGYIKLVKHKYIKWLSGGLFSEIHEDRDVYGLDSFTIVNQEIQSVLYKKNIINLPYLLSDNFIIKMHKYIDASSSYLGSDKDESYILNSSKDLGIKLTKEYYYKREGTDSEVFIASYTDCKNHTWEIPTTISEGTYELILKISMPSSEMEKIKNSTGFTGTNILNFSFNSDNSPVFNEEIYDPFGGGKISDAGDSEIGKTSEIVIKWKGISILNDYSSEVGNKINWEHKSIYDGIQKALNLIKPLEGNSTSRYKLDPDFYYLGNSYIRDIINSENGDIKKVDTKMYPCPEIKFQNQKSLYEILTDLGREFYGIPRLGKEINGEWDPNIITFDVLTQSFMNAANSETFEDQNTLESVKSTMDNHSTGYVSNLSNVITNDFYNIYPAGELWTTTRSQSESDPLVSKDNMAIVVDKPIYRLQALYVRNVAKKGSDSELRFPDYIDITRYVDEETIYNCLNNDEKGKGRSIYYKQGDNKILGLGNIPQASKTQAAWGIEPDLYIIQNILISAIGIPKNEQNDPSDFEYKVIYIPYNDITIYTEQKNISGLKNSNYKALNQDNNIIYDNYFGRSAQTQIERLGNNNIQKVYQYQDWLNMPRLGQIKQFNGYNYYADEITYTFNNNYKEAIVSFSKNFNKINERVGIDAAYRLYRIYANNYVDRSINVNQYCYLSKEHYSIEYENYKNISENLVENIMNSLNSRPSIKMDMLHIQSYNIEDKRLQYNDYSSGDLKDVPAAILPVSYNVFSNSICYSAEFYDNFSAGIKASDYYSEGKQYIQKDVRYVDTNGESTSIEFTLFRYTESLNNKKIFNNVRSLPEASFITNPSSTISNNIYSQKIKIDKDNLEKLKFVYQLHFQTYDKNLTIHNGLTNNLFINHTLINSDDIEVGFPKYLLFKNDVSKQNYLGSDNSYQIIETKPTIDLFTSTTIKISSVEVVANDDYDGFALFWPKDGLMIYSYKTQIKKGETFTIDPIYLNFTNEKLEYQNR